MVDQGAARVRQGQGAKLWPTMEQSRTRPKVRRQRRSRGGCNRVEQGPRLEDGDKDRSWGQFAVVTKPNSLVSQIGPSGFSEFRTEEDVEDHFTQDGTSTSLVSTGNHAQLEEEDPMDEGVEAKGRKGREGERSALQQHSASDPYEARMKGEGEDQHTCAHSLR
jgi:hypothetical protein